MHDHALGEVWTKALSQVLRGDMPVADKTSALLELMINICKTAVSNTGIQFHTVFSIIAYTGHMYSLPSRMLFNIHKFRREATSSQSALAPDPERLGEIYLLGLRVVYDLIRLIYRVSPPPHIIELLPSDSIYRSRQDKVVHFKRYHRVLVVEKDDDQDMLIAIDQLVPEEKVLIKYNLPDRNEIFNESISFIGTTLKLPMEMNLVDVEVDEDGYYLPRALIIEPDFLIDITAVASCFQSSGITTAGYFARRFIPVSTSKSIMLGNIANYFLDELMADPALKFKDLKLKIFQLDPLAFSLYDDATVREIVSKAQLHFTSLKTVVNESFKKQGIDVDHCFLEPTFYSEQYGLQGRLDVLFDDPNREEDTAIIELKSGKTFKPNVYGLNQDHYVQTLLYDLLIKSASSDKLKPTNYILYSVKDVDHLRFAPAVRSQQYEAMAVRNHLIAVESRISKADQILRDPDRFLNWIKEEAKGLMGFLLRDMNLIADRYGHLSMLEKKYFLSMVSMVAREHRLAKIGVEGDRRNNGQASLWLNTVQEKEDQFNILSNLRISKNDAGGVEPIIIFERTEKTNTLANFRKGDLTMVYPSVEGNSPLSTQLFKGTIILIDEQQITIRLRAKQFNNSLFSDYEFWNVEHDSLDSGFNTLYRSLFRWTDFDPQSRSFFLGTIPPSDPVDVPWESSPLMTPEQNRIMKKILSAQSYFLLWGPPGTGKTSVIVKELIAYLMRSTEEQILMVAYTNRAVDELCRALVSAGEKDFLRIGSRYSSHPDFTDNLLSVQTNGISQRQELRDLISGKRIVVGTISSMLGRSELFKLKTFDRLIIDEATQVLEPMLAGLLPMFKKVLLIGDHRQLAAVVVQPQEHREVKDEALLAIGLKDLGSSYFERYFTRCEEKEWNWAFDRLSFQGRMHRDVMAFASAHFYGGMLNVLPDGMSQRQLAPWEFGHVADDPISQVLSTRRVLFLPVISGELFNSKINIEEARLVGDVLSKLYDLHRDSAKTYEWNEVGVITPFRAQISQIKMEIAQRGIPLNEITVDTVERYQGGAKKIILISLCVNSESQLKSLISLSADGVDRKLNVALTRAEEQVIVIGDPEVLSNDEIYKDFITQYQVLI